MCGIFGFQLHADAMEDWQVKVLAGTLGMLNDERGGHSWGLVTVGDSIQVDKGLGELAENRTAAEIAKGLAVMGHTRYASTGEVTIKNAHPFELGSLIGAHNGIVANHQELNVRHQRTCEVDSEHIFLHLQERKPLEELEVWGAIQLVKVEQPHSFFVGRFSSGDLAICGIGDAEASKGVVWSSDRRHLFAALRLAGVTFFEYRVDPTELYEIENGRLWRGEKILKTTAPRYFLDQPRHPKMSSTGTKTKGTGNGGRYDDWMTWGNDDDEELSGYAGYGEYETADACEMCGVEASHLVTVSEVRFCRDCLDRWGD